MSAEPITTASLNQPILFERQLFEKVWGGRSLEATLGIVLGVAGPVGETWELVDREECNSKVLAGSSAGRTLHELMGAHGAALLGAARPSRGGRFPVLIKFLSATKPLSVQVHPDELAAKKLGRGESGKDEAWYILAAEPQSQIYLGLRPGVDAREFAARAGGPGVVDLLRAWPVRAGEFVFVPGGTIHAIGEGITLLEVQNNSDVTYRLYDWDRLGLDGKPRPCHRDEALLCARYDAPVQGPVEPRFTPRGGNRAAQLVDCPAFRMELLEIGTYMDLDTDGRAVIYVALAGAGRLRSAGSEALARMKPGDTWLVPAALGPHRIEPEGPRLTVMRVETQR
jgi:mannose-6-phosphate isomerase